MGADGDTGVMELTSEKGSEYSGHSGVNSSAAHLVSHLMSAHIMLS